MAASFSILCVCTGNVCRSPAAERLLQEALGPDISVESAGTLALVGERISPPMDRLIVLAGASAGNFRARQLNEPMLRAADLILAMADAHIGPVVELSPRAVRRTFTLRGFARLLHGVDRSCLTSGSAADRLRAAIPLAAAARRPQLDRQQDDVLDPFRQAESIYEAAFDDIRSAVDRIADVVGSDREKERR